VIFQAGDSDQGRNLGARISEGVYTNAESFEDAKAYYDDLKARAVALGRDPDHIVVLPGLIPIIADTVEEAQAREDKEQGKLDLEKALVQLGRPFNYHDFAQYDLDGPFPDVSNLSLNSYKGHAEKIVRTAAAEGLTLRQTAWLFAARRNPFVGTAQTVADEIERWFLGRATDGFNFRVTNPVDFARFVDEVVPILQERGLFRTDYEHETLRGHLGLPIPENRYSAAPVAIAAE
jgi:alkanesulfonate monooxygenase SsuD/methylene tetrahydromethanopterin reductase-like flavin-dependent oxidoreductase (luciferase family)